MAERSLFIDDGPGERRAVVALGDAPERLLIEREGDAYPRLGARYAGRVARIDRGSGLALLDLGLGLQGALRLKADRAPPVEGARLEIEIAIEPQGDKAAVARAIGETRADPGLLAAAPSLEARLEAWAPGGAIERGMRARDMADEAEALVLAVEHRLVGGGSIAIETTRALTAVDVDLGGGEGREIKRAARRANLAAIAQTARMLRLRAQGGLVVMDLVGRGHDGPALAQAARSAFAPDEPGVAIGPISRFGTLELALPRRWRPVTDILCDGGREPSSATLALRLLRAVEREGRADPGSRLLVRANPKVLAAAAGWSDRLTDVLGARIGFAAVDGLPVDAWEISRQ